MTTYVLMVSEGTEDYRNSNEGPFDTLESAVTFANAECGVLWQVVRLNYGVPEAVVASNDPEVEIEEES